MPLSLLKLLALVRSYGPAVLEAVLSFRELVKEWREARRATKAPEEPKTHDEPPADRTG